MPVVKTQDGTQDIFLTSLDHMTTAHDASSVLWNSVFQASKIHGGEVTLKTPSDGETGYLVTWINGPQQWADAYVVSEGLDVPDFAVMAEAGTSVRVLDLD